MKDLIVFPKESLTHFLCTRKIHLPCDVETVNYIPELVAMGQSAKKTNFQDFLLGKL